MPSSTTAATVPKIILFHYTFSPYARRVTWYLNLRKIPYSQCIQPPTMPRPILAALGISHRRIPLLSIGNTVYVDSRLILSVLDALFPPSLTHPSSTPPSLSPPSSPPSQNTLYPFLLNLLSSWTSEGGVFNRAAALIPLDSPLMKDERFRRDREDFSGRKWDYESMKAGRAEAVYEIRRWCSWVEGVLKGVEEGEWVFEGENGGPGRGDIELIWPFHWLTTLPGALPPSFISPSGEFPLLHAYIQRFDTAVRTAIKTHKPSVTTISGSEAKEIILGSEPGSGFVKLSPPHSDKRTSEAGLRKGDMGVSEEEGGLLGGLKEGDEIEVWPVDSGRSGRDRGILRGLDREVVVLGKSVEGKGLSVVVPRHGFKVRKVGGEDSKL